MGYAGSGNLTEEKIEKLRGIGFRLAPSYDEMYERLVAARVGAHAAGITGPPEVDDGEDGELSEWAKEQKKMMARHSKGQPIPLSNDRIGKLISVAAEAEVQAEAAAAADEAEEPPASVASAASSDSEAFIPLSDSDDSDDSPLAKRTKSEAAPAKKAPPAKKLKKTTDKVCACFYEFIYCYYL
jgi:hypothetical protein